MKGFISKAYHDVPRVPLFQPYLNVATQKNISGYCYWFHRQVDYRSHRQDVTPMASLTPRCARAECARLPCWLTSCSRLVTVIPTLIGVIIVTFLLTRVLPGDPAVYFAGPAATPQSIAEIRKSLGLDKPLPEQFLRYVDDLAHGNLGNSLATGRPVISEIASRLPASAELTLFGLFISIAIAIPLGILAAVKQGSWIDHTCRIVATAGVSLAGVLHRPAAGLRVLLPARLGAGAARPARRFLRRAAARHRLLPDRQPDRRRLRAVSRGA